MDPRVATYFYEIFDAMQDVFEKHNIRWWLCSGSLLGQVRHDGIIPWDDDGDSQVHPDDLQKLESEEIKKAFREKGFEMVKHWLGYKIQIPLENRPDFLKDPKYIENTEGDQGEKYTSYWPNVDIFSSERNEQGRITFTGRAKKYWPNENWSDDELFKDGKVPLKNFGPIQVPCL